MIYIFVTVLTVAFAHFVNGFLEDMPKFVWVQWIMIFFLTCYMILSWIM